MKFIHFANEFKTIQSNFRKNLQKLEKAVQELEDSEWSGYRQESRKEFLDELTKLITQIPEIDLTPWNISERTEEFNEEAQKSDQGTEDEVELAKPVIHTSEHGIQLKTTQYLTQKNKDGIEEKVPLSAVEKFVADIANSFQPGGSIIQLLPSFAKLAASSQHYKKLFPRLESLLLLPFQTMLRYPLLLQRGRDEYPGDTSALTSAVENLRKHIADINDWLDSADVSQQGLFVEFQRLTGASGAELSADRLSQRLQRLISNVSELVAQQLKRPDISSKHRQQLLGSRQYLDIVKKNYLNNLPYLQRTALPLLGNILNLIKSPAVVQPPKQKTAVKSGGFMSLFFGSAQKIAAQKKIHPISSTRLRRTILGYRTL